MSTTLADRLRRDAATYPELAALLGSNPFRWFDLQLPQIAQSGSFPAIVVQQISGNGSYVLGGQQPTGWSRFQFLIWGGQFAAGAEARFTVRAALLDFLNQWNGGIGYNAPAYPNQLVLDRDALYPQTDGPVYQRICDFMIFSNDNVS